MIDFNISKEVMTPPARRVRHVKVGDKIKITEEMKQTEYSIVHVYPFHATGINENGKMRSFNVGDLVKLGLEPSGDRDRLGGIGIVNDYD